jgi:hypothetical protein
VLGPSVSSEADPRAPVVDGHDRGDLPSASRGLLSRIRRLNRAMGVTLPAGATSAVKTIKMSARLAVVGPDPVPEGARY